MKDIAKKIIDRIKKWSLLRKVKPMTTDDPPSCNQEIFNKGECVFITHTIPSNELEKWVKKIAEKSGQPVDWHYCGGRARILALGDISKVSCSMKELMPEHDALMKKETDQILQYRNYDRRKNEQINN